MKKFILLLLLIGAVPLGVKAGGNDSLLLTSSGGLVIDVKNGLNGFNLGSQASFSFTFSAIPDTATTPITAAEFWYRPKGDTSWIIVNTVFNGSYWESALYDLVLPSGTDTVEYTVFVTNDTIITNPPPGEFYIELTGSLLPIKLLSFDGERTEAGTVKLDWITETETNSREFIIEASKNAFEWKPIGRIRAAGNSHEGNYYSFNYSGPGEYFRLKMVDLDDSFELSNIIFVKNTDHLGVCFWNGNNFVCNEEILVIFDPLGRAVSGSLLNGYYFVKTITGQIYKVVVP